MTAREPDFRGFPRRRHRRGGTKKEDRKAENRFRINSTSQRDNKIINCREQDKGIDEHREINENYNYIIRELFWLQRPPGSLCAEACACNHCASLSRAHSQRHTDFYNVLFLSMYGRNYTSSGLPFFFLLFPSLSILSFLSYFNHGSLHFSFRTLSSTSCCFSLCMGGITLLPVSLSSFYCFVKYSVFSFIVHSWLPFLLFSQIHVISCFPSFIHPVSLRPLPPPPL